MQKIFFRLFLFITPEDPLKVLYRTNVLTTTFTDVDHFVNILSGLKSYAKRIVFQKMGVETSKKRSVWPFLDNRRH